MNRIYVQTNDAERNEVIAFDRSDDGRLQQLGRYETGGRGTGKPHIQASVEEDFLGVFMIPARRRIANAAFEAAKLRVGSAVIGWLLLGTLARINRSDC